VFHFPLFVRKLSPALGLQCDLRGYTTVGLGLFILHCFSCAFSADMITFVGLHAGSEDVKLVG
jgi:hypothetical protein